MHRLPLIGLLSSLMLILAAGAVAAQATSEVSGRVVDSETGSGIAGVSVFVANTTIGAATDASGRFAIRAVSPGMFELVASAIGYTPEALTLNVGAGGIDSLTIRLRPTSYELDEVAVEAERPRGWRRDLAHFTELFLGSSENARNTVLLNPYVLDFQREGEAFVATASEPLRMENRALGYRITYVLGSLFEGRESASQYMGRYTMYYTGHIFFEEMDPRDEEQRERWAENRRDSFEGSLQHFLWALTRDRLAEEGFDLRPGYVTDQGRVAQRQSAAPVEPESILSPSERTGYFLVRSDDPLVVRHEVPQSLNLFGLRIPIGTGTEVTTITLRSSPALVHTSGYAHSPLGPQNPLAVTGSMSRRRIADMLPRDYVRTWEAARPAVPPIAPRPPDAATLVGLVRDARSQRPVADAVVRAVMADGSTAAVRTGADGRFTLMRDDEIIIVATGYLPARLLTAAAGTDALHVDLVPLAEALIADEGFGSNLAFPSAAEAGPVPSKRLGEAAGYIRARSWKRAEEALNEILKVDSADVEARYFRAIAARERGKLHLPLQAILPGNAVDRSRADFELLAQSHANYRDVLFQHAMLEWYDGRFERAVELAHAQSVLKPGLMWARLGLFRLGQSLLHHRSAAQVHDFLSPRKAPFYRFLEAESARLANRLNEAEQLLSSISTGALFPGVPVQLSRARIAFARGDEAVGQRLVEETISGIRTPLDAWFLMEDFKTVLEPEEFERFVAISTADGHVQFFRGFWTRRDPDRASRENPRLAEHYARVAFAEQNFYFDGLRAEFNTAEVDYPVARDVFALAPRVKYPDAYWLNHAFDDRGLVYIRHGEPQDRAFSTTADRANVSWRYYREGGPFDFHFVVSAMGAHDNWRLVPYLPADMIASRASWGHPYSVEVWSGSEILESNQGAIAAALTTDTYAWDAEVEPLDVPYRSVAFRGENGTTLMRLYYALTGDLEPADSVRLSLTAHDRNWNEVYAAEQRPRGAFVFEARLDPDTLHLALNASADAGRRIGAYRWSQVLPDFDTTALVMSDVVVLHAAAASRADAPRWGNPTGRHDRTSPLHLYFEVYGLTFDGTDRTSYEIEYRLEPLERRRGLLGLGRTGGAALSVRTTHSGSARDTDEQGQIDVSGVRPGGYVLHVTVQDQTSGATATRLLQLTID